MFSALETFVIIALYKSTFTIPYHTIPLVVTHQLQVERRTVKVRLSETDVLPLCYATWVVPGKGPLNGCLRVCLLVCVGAVRCRLCVVGVVDVRRYQRVCGRPTTVQPRPLPQHARQFPVRLPHRLPVQRRHRRLPRYSPSRLTKLLRPA